MSRSFFALPVLALAVVQSVLLVVQAKTLAPTGNEKVHLNAGLDILAFGTFGTDLGNPPIAKALAALPVAIWRGDGDCPREAHQYWIFDERCHGVERVIAISRLGCLPLVWLGAWVCWRWAGELYGKAGGWLALSLWCFSPMVLAYGALITADMAATAMGVLAAYGLWQWWLRPSWLEAVCSGMLVGLALLAKMVWVIWFPLVPIIWLLAKMVGATGGRGATGGSRASGLRSAKAIPAARAMGEEQTGATGGQGATGGIQASGLRSAKAIPPACVMGEEQTGATGGQGATGGLSARAPVHSLALRVGIVALARRLPRSGWFVEAGQVAVILLVALLVLNWGYVFERTLLPLSTYENYFEDITGREVPEALRKIPVPLPENYVRGMWEINRVMEHGHRSYLAGQWRDRGWWYYYLYGMVVKNPLGMLGLVAIALVVGRVGRARSGEQRAESMEVGGESRDELFVLVPGIAFLAFVSYFSNMSHHFRYAMPFLPFCFIYAGRAARYVTQGPRVLGGLVVVCWTAAVIGSLWNWPHSLSYFNELAGGPIGGRQHMINSSLDWGQDLLFLKRWLEAHPEARPLNLVYFGGVDPRLVGIEYQLPDHLRRTERGVRSGEGGEERVESGEMLSRSESRQSAGGLLRSTPATRPRPSATSGRATHFPDQQRPPPGWYAISVNYVMGTQGSAPDGQGNLVSLRADACTSFQQLTPVARAGYSIDIYHVRSEE